MKERGLFAGSDPLVPLSIRFMLYPGWRFQKSQFHTNGLACKNKSAFHLLATFFVKLCRFVKWVYDKMHKG